MEQIQAIRLFGAAGELTWHQDDWGLHISMPVQKPCEHAYTKQNQTRQLVLDVDADEPFEQLIHLTSELAR